MMRCASNDRQQKDDFIIHLAINDKATRLQVIENMPDMMQLRKKVIPQSMQNEFKQEKNANNKKAKVKRKTKKQEKKLYPAMLIEIDDS